MKQAKQTQKETALETQEISTTGACECIEAFKETSEYNHTPWIIIHQVYNKTTQTLETTKVLSIKNLGLMIQVINQSMNGISSSLHFVVNATLAYDGKNMPFIRKEN